MTAKSLTAALTGAAALSIAWAGAAQAHNPKGGGAGLPQVYVKRLIEAQKALEAMDGSDQAKGMYSTLVQWPPQYTKLRVCFFDGNQKARQAVADVGREWIRNDVGLKLDFGKKGKLRDCNPDDDKEDQIRISFAQPGYWSQLGQNAVAFTAQNEVSLNLDGFDKFPPEMLKEGEARGIILHEFGHALGLLHEHQSPGAVCHSEFNWDFINTKLAEPPNSWDQETIDFNMRPFSGEDLMLTDFDAKSVMLYSFPPEYYAGGDQSKCYIGNSNNDISEVDHVTVAYMYPLEPSARMENFQKRQEEFKAIAAKAAESGKKGVMIDLINVFFEGVGTKDIPDEAD